MSLMLFNMYPVEVAAVERALELLRWAVPDEYFHLMREIRSIGVEENACGTGAIACTAGDLDRHVTLAVPPCEMDVVELAVTLSHEARHHLTDQTGHHIIDHTCIDCTDPWERERDAIYIHEEWVRAQLMAALTRPRYVYSLPARQLARPKQPVRDAAILAGVALLGVAIAGMAIAHYAGTTEASQGPGAPSLPLGRITRPSSRTTGSRA